MLVPGGEEIEENGFSATVSSPLDFDDLESIEIHRHYEHGFSKIEYYIESIQKSLSLITTIKVSNDNEILKIECI